jgi:hypothetical protein
MMLVKMNAPSPASLGQSNGIVQFAMCFSRAFAPFLVRCVAILLRVQDVSSWCFSSMFAISIDYNLLGGYLWAVIMVAVSFMGATISRKIEQNSVKTVE